MATLQEIEAIAAEISAAQKRLAAAVLGSPELFTKKRSMVICGVKTGFQARHSSLSWGDDGALVARIRECMPQHFHELVDVSETPKKEALAELDPETLRALDVRIDPGGTRVIVRFVEAADDKQLSLPLTDEVTS